MAILDGRTLLDDADADTNWVDTAGGTGLGVDTEIFIQGGGTPASIPYSLGNSIAGVMYNAGSAQDWSNNHFYIWFNCSLGGNLDTKASGGVRVRFAGATIGDYFEVFVDGKDTYSGGWKMLVVDIEKAKTASDGVGGTPPATNAIQYVGVTGDTAGFMPRKVDNFWVDAIWRLPSGTAGINVEGTNSGPDWTWDDIVAAAATNPWGTCTKANGVVFINTPITFGANDAVTHGFSDTNQVIAWEDKLVADAFYGIDVIGGSGTQSFELGIKTGTGDTATGAQGCVITADSAGVRWYLDADDANVDAANFYGCQFSHGADFQLDDAQVSTISTLFLDCTSATVSNAGDFLRNSIVAANTADGVAFITTDDLSDIKYCAFAFSDGHAIELTTPNTSSQTTLGNTFTGYGSDATNDAAVYNNSGSGLVTISVTGGVGGDSPTVRNGTSATTSVESSVTVRVEGVTEGSAVSVIANETAGTITIGDVIMQGLADSTGIYQITTLNYEGAFGAGLDVISRVRQQGLPNSALSLDGGVYGDETTAANSSTVDDMTLTPTAPVINVDGYLFGHAEEFGQIKIDVSRIFTGTDLVITWQYSDSGSTFANLSGVVDGTDSFKNLGENTVSWTIPGSWSTATYDSIGPIKYIRALVTTISGITQSPLGRRCKLDVTRYLPFTADRIITSSGLTVVASWNADTIAQF